MAGFNVPPGVSLSDPGGPEDPARVRAERIEEELFNAFYAAIRADYSVGEINAVWEAAAETAHDDEEADQFAEQLMEAEAAEWERRAEAQFLADADTRRGEGE